MDGSSSATLNELSDASRPVSLPVDSRAMQGVWLLLASLGVFFFSSIFLYAFYVYSRYANPSGHVQGFHLPLSFIPSTVLLIGVSACLEIASRAARRDRFETVTKFTLMSTVFGVGFLAVQADGMTRLIQGLSDASTRNESVYGLTFLLAFLHAAHVVGGVVGLWISSRNALSHRYDHERNFGIRFCALYWHFLDAVWLCMIASFLLTSLLLNKP